MPHEAHVTPEMRLCIQECLRCHASCLETVQHCLGLGGAHSGARHIGLLLSCAEVCQTSANLMLHATDWHLRTCGLCAEICTACATECDDIADGDPTMRQCADTCRRCAAVCGEMAAAHSHAHA